MNAETHLLSAVRSGLLSVDSQGRVWRHGYDGRYGRVTFRKARRAENDSGRYLQVRLQIDGRRHCAKAARLVYRVLVGPIPARLTVNHESGDKHDNRPGNLNLMTNSEQQLHALHVLHRGRWAA